MRASQKMDGWTEFLPIQQYFVPYWGRCKGIIWEAVSLTCYLAAQIERKIERKKECKKKRKKIRNERKKKRKNKKERNNEGGEKNKSQYWLLDAPRGGFSTCGTDGWTDGQTDGQTHL